MNCRSVRNTLSQYLDGDLSPPARAAVAAHLETCPRCRSSEAALRRAEQALHSLAALEAAPHLTDDLRARLASPAPRPLWPAWAAAAAVVATALALLLLRAPQAPSPHAPPAPQTHAAAPSVTLEQPQPTLIPLVVAPAPESPRADGTPTHTLYTQADITPVRADEAARGPLPAGEASPPAPQPVLADTPEAPYGIILLLGEPQPILPSSKCYLEVALPGGARSILDQSVERDAAGKPLAVQLSYQDIASEPNALGQGGST